MPIRALKEQPWWNYDSGIFSFRSSRLEVFCKKVAGGACNFIKKETLTQVFSCEFCKISKNTFFYRTPPVAASAVFGQYVRKLDIKFSRQDNKVMLNIDKCPDDPLLQQKSKQSLFTT